MSNPAKEFLQGYILLKVRRDAYINEIRDLRADACRVSVSYDADRVTSSPSGDRLEMAIIHMVETAEKLDEMVVTIDKRMRDISEAINRTSREEYRTLLTLRYIRGYQWEAIQHAMHYEERWIFKLHGRALEEVNAMIRVQ